MVPIIEEPYGAKPIDQHAGRLIQPIALQAFTEKLPVDVELEEFIIRWIRRAEELSRLP